MNTPSSTTPERRESLLRAVLPVFGRYGYRKTSVEDLATAAGLSKQGLYLHFPSKEAIFIAAMQAYLDDCLIAVEAALNAPSRPLADRLVAAMEAWFGRHLTVFTPESFDVIEAGDRLSAATIEGYKRAFKARLASAFSADEAADLAPCSPQEMAEVLFRFGLTWKEDAGDASRFRAALRLCVKACCRLSPNEEPATP